LASSSSTSLLAGCLRWGKLTAVKAGKFSLIEKESPISKKVSIRRSKSSNKKETDEIENDFLSQPEDGKPQWAPLNGITENVLNQLIGSFGQIYSN
jgi:hypothetical protein